MTTSAAGDLEYAALKGLLLNSGLSLGVGVAIAAYGCYLWLVKQNGKAGFTLLLTSVLISLTPKLLDGFKEQFCPAIKNMGGECGKLSYDTGTATGTDSTGGAGDANGGNPTDVTIGTDGKAVVMPAGTNPSNTSITSGFNFSGINAGQQQ